MLITVPNIAAPEQRAARLAALRFIIESAETVDTYCADYLIVGELGGTIDREQVEADRVDHLARVLAELDAIVSSLWEYPLMEAVTTEARFGAETVERARTLAQAIRECIAEIAGTHRLPAKSADSGEVVDHYSLHSVDCDRHSSDDDAACSKDCLRRSAEAGDGRPEAIAVTGQIALLRQSIIEGQPWGEQHVEVVEIDGDVLTYTTDRVWKSTATRSATCEWSIVEPRPAFGHTGFEAGAL